MGVKAENKAGKQDGGRHLGGRQLRCHPAAAQTGPTGADAEPGKVRRSAHLLDQALAYNYGDHAFKALQAKKLPDARADAEKAVRYTPNNPDSHMTLGFLDYLTGDKNAALGEMIRVLTKRALMAAAQ